MILNRIQDHPVFGPQQAAMQHQLQVTLRRFGSSIDTIQVGQMFGIGDGTVSLYTRRVCTALMSLWKDVVQWPTEEEQIKIRLRNHSTWSVWEDCIGILDGTLIPFTSKPGIPKDQRQTTLITESSSTECKQLLYVMTRIILHILPVSIQVVFMILELLKLLLLEVAKET